MDLLKLLHGFVKAVTYIFSPLPKKTKMKCVQDFDFVDWLRQREICRSWVPRKE